MIYLPHIFNSVTHLDSACNHFNFLSPNDNPPHHIVILDFILHHSCMSLSFHYKIVFIVTYPPSANTRTFPMDNPIVFFGVLVKTFSATGGTTFIWFRPACGDPVPFPFTAYYGTYSGGLCMILLFMILVIPCSVKINRWKLS